MITEFFGDIIIRKEDVKRCQTFVPGDALAMRFEEPCYVIVVRSKFDVKDGGNDASCL